MTSKLSTATSKTIKKSFLLFAFVAVSNIALLSWISVVPNAASHG
jgi:hypothetical protein